ncbi:zf-HC2 domain-containing protein [Streptomyces sp. NBC_00683]|uniref:zf-HC2 domain-containing protein n=2 Tax=unclassified Streptomyces TaxID=2593676 RepID=UPI002E334ED8|nr:zf-HC2 domain-containing protein [Streptomyces sp. NBC_00683]
MSDLRVRCVRVGMRILEPHRDVGAYVLGVLGAADAFRFEEHLTECSACGVQVREFGEVAAQLAVYVRRTPAGVAPVADAGPELLHRIVAVARAGRRTSRRRRLALVAAAVVLGVGGPAAVAGLYGGSPPGPAAAERWAGGDRGTGVSAVVTTGEREWGSDVGLEVARAPAAGSCALVAVGRDGSKQTVSTWSGTGTGPGEEPAVVRGGAALRPAEIDHFEVWSSDGQWLATVTR